MHVKTTTQTHGAKKIFEVEHVWSTEICSAKLNSEKFGTPGVSLLHVDIYALQTYQSINLKLTLTLNL